LRTDYTDLHSTVPTQDQVLVPETLLKKRKSQEQARAAAREEAAKKKAVSAQTFLFSFFLSYGDDTNHHATRLPVDAVAFVNHLSGLRILLMLLML
jgi:hypothetical protein